MAVHIRSIEILQGSCDTPCYPRDQATWQEDFPVTDPARIGIGYLVEPERFVWTPIPYSLHDHEYSQPHIPNAARAAVIYEFTASTAIRDVVIIQHTNGVVEVEGFAGDNPDPNGPWRSMGIAQSRLVGSATGAGIFPEFARDVFEFRPAAPISGKCFRLVIRKTSLPNGWAMYRAYPRNKDGDILNPASASIVPLNMVA
jgi:hypothetical protein